MGANNGTGDSYSKYTIPEHSLFFVIIHVVLLFCIIVLQNCVNKNSVQNQHHKINLI